MHYYFGPPMHLLSGVDRQLTERHMHSGVGAHEVHRPARDTLAAERVGARDCGLAVSFIRELLLPDLCSDLATELADLVKD